MENPETILVVDDDPSIRSLLKMALPQFGYNTLEAQSGEELYRLLSEQTVDLLLLDIRLPGVDGLTLLPDIRQKFPKTYVVMITGVVDIQTALLAIRQGAFDYIAKPFPLEELRVVIGRVFERRRLERENLQYLRSIQEKNLRLEILHALSLKIGNSLLGTVELEEIFRIIMVGITAGEGLGLNRAFLSLFDREGSTLAGKIAIGPGSPEEAGRIWSSLEGRKFSLAEAINEYGRTSEQENIRVNQLVKAIGIPVTAEDNILIRAARERRSFNVRGGRVAEGPIPEDTAILLGTSDFAVVPLCSSDRVPGVLIADNAITGKEITGEDLAIMELFANQAALAIEKSQLVSELDLRVKSLEAAQAELQAGRDLLIRVERLSALGEMAAQIAHEMRNPLTSIGGLARFVQRRLGEEKLKDHLEVIIRETGRLERILDQLFGFIQTPTSVLREMDPREIIASCLLILGDQLVRQQIEVKRDFASDRLTVLADRDQITEVLMTLFRNALEAMSAGGTLRVAAGREGEEVVIDIEDTGPGLSADDLALARRPFFTTKIQGLGLGLNLAEKILETHGGRLELTGAFGAGVRARVILPVPPVIS